MRRDLGLWLGVMAAGIVGALLPGLFIALDPPKGHTQGDAVWIMLAPFFGILTAVLWAVAMYAYRRTRRP